jgi:O-antigen biosynthesis protein WbqV
LTDAWSFLLERPEILLPRGVLASVLDGRRILITGAAGSVGTALCRLAASFDPQQLVLLDSHEASLARLGRDLDLLGSQPRPRLVLADVRDGRKLRQVLGRFGADVVFHLAAYKQVPLGESNVDQVLDVNIMGTANVVAACRELTAATLVYPSTDKAVQPSSLYGATKRIVERFLCASATQPGAPIRVVRLVNVFGTQGSVVEIFADSIAHNRPLTITDLAMDRYWISMGEAMQLIVAAAGRPSFEGIYLLDAGAPVPIVRTAESVYRHVRPGASELPLRIIGSRPGERLHEILHYPEEKLRPTNLRGLLVAQLPPSPAPVDAWEGELAKLSERMLELDSDELRTWAFRIAADGPTGAQADSVEQMASDNSR